MRCCGYMFMLGWKQWESCTCMVRPHIFDLHRKASSNASSMSTCYQLPPYQSRASHAPRTSTHMLRLPSTLIPLSCLDDTDQLPQTASRASGEEWFSCFADNVEVDSAVPPLIEHSNWRSKTHCCRWRQAAQCSCIVVPN